MKLVPAPRSLLASCRAMAQRVGYRVPCPVRLPVRMTFEFSTPFSGAWKGWVAGSGYRGRGSTPITDHLAITASPRPLADASKLVNGPAWYRGERVRFLEPVTAGGRHMKAYFVSPYTNDGSMFMHHVVFVWTEGGHTYGVGFHDTGNRKRAEALTAAVAASIRLVPPPR